MQVKCTIEDQLINGAAPDELEQTIRTSLILYKYLQAELSLGEVSELLEITLEDTLDWLSTLGIPSSRPMAAELEAASARHAQILLDGLRDDTR